MRYKIPFLTLALALSQANFAMTTSPAHCPKLSAIQTAEVQKAMPIAGGWAVYTTGKFNTNQEWLVWMMTVSPVKNAQEAVKQGNRQLKVLSEVDGPSKIDDEWSCSYMGIDLDLGPVVAIAYTPPPETLNPETLIGNQ